MVNADIMLEFSIGNLFIDIFSCAIFLSRIIQEQKEQRNLKRYATSNGTQAENVDFEMHKAFVQDWVSHYYVFQIIYLSFTHCNLMLTFPVQLLAEIILIRLHIYFACSYQTLVIL